MKGVRERLLLRFSCTTSLCVHLLSAPRWVTASPCTPPYSSRSAWLIGNANNWLTSWLFGMRITGIPSDRRLRCSVDLDRDVAGDVVHELSEHSGGRPEKQHPDQVIPTSVGFHRSSD